MAGHRLVQRQRRQGVEPREVAAVVVERAQWPRLGQVHQGVVEARVAVERHALGVRLGRRDEAMQLVLEHRPVDARRGRHARGELWELPQAPGPVGVGQAGEARIRVEGGVAHARTGVRR
jgi:hypothetical protein